MEHRYAQTPKRGIELDCNSNEEDTLALATATITANERKRFGIFEEDSNTANYYFRKIRISFSVTECVRNQAYLTFRASAVSHQQQSNKAVTRWALQVAEVILDMVLTVIGRMNVCFPWEIH